ncbi:MAG: Nif3-like dinuclear metal center hexameric protein [Ruminococcaceae bacterium]|nr:Nif3-like dinuclear metal center hexameric protein [Oscillospiraceae bacterium]
MTVTELHQYISAFAPRALSADWDNDGIACAAQPDHPVQRVLVALDATERVVKRAVEEKFDLLLTHHPLLFRGIKELTPAHTVSRKLLRLVGGEVAAMSFHTRLDAAVGGVNDILAEILGLANTVPFGPVGEELGRVGDLPEGVEVSKYARTVCEKLNTPAVLLVGTGKIKKVAVLGGEGGDFVDAAFAAGADLLVAGRIGYHRMLDGAEEGIALIEAGHFATEVAVCHKLAALVKAADPTVFVEIDVKPTIQMVTK